MNRDKNLTKALIFGLLGFFCMAIMGVLLRNASTSNISSIWINFILYLTGTILLAPALIYNGWDKFKTKRFPLHFCRAFFGFIASTLYTASTSHIPLLNATLLFNTAPIFIPILAIFLMKQKISWLVWFSIILGFIGIYVIINPDAQTLTQPGNLIALGSGICLALAYVFIAMLTSTESRLNIVGYFFLIATILQLPLLFFLSNTPTWLDVLYSIGAGISLTLAQICIVMAYQNAAPAKVGIFQYSTVIFVAIIDRIVWHVIPNERDIIGTLIVMIAGTMIITAPLWSKGAPAKNEP
jgi:drug/metabolite transporter (DMT)-like permease